MTKWKNSTLIIKFRHFSISSFAFRRCTRILPAQESIWSSAASNRDKEERSLSQGKSTLRSASLAAISVKQSPNCFWVVITLLKCDARARASVKMCVYRLWTSRKASMLCSSSTSTVRLVYKKIESVTNTKTVEIFRLLFLDVLATLAA